MEENRNKEKASKTRIERSINRPNKRYHLYPGESTRKDPPLGLKFFSRLPDFSTLPVASFALPRNHSSFSVVTLFSLYFSFRRHLPLVSFFRRQNPLKVLSFPSPFSFLLPLIWPVAFLPRTPAALSFSFQPSHPPSLSNLPQPSNSL